MESPLASASFNNTVAASARCARSGVHGAYGARKVDDCEEVGRSMTDERSCWRRAGNL